MRRTLGKYVAYERGELMKLRKAARVLGVNFEGDCGVEHFRCFEVAELVRWTCRGREVATVVRHVFSGSWRWAHDVTRDHGDEHWLGCFWLWVQS